MKKLKLPIEAAFRSFTKHLGQLGASTAPSKTELERKGLPDPTVKMSQNMQIPTLPVPAVMPQDPCWTVVQTSLPVAPATFRVIKEMKHANTIVIDGMSPIIGSIAIEFAFGIYGIVRTHFVLNDKNEFLGRVMVEFATPESAKKAIEERNGVFLCLNPMKIRLATEISNLNVVVIETRKKKKTPRKKGKNSMSPLDSQKVEASEEAQQSPAATSVTPPSMSSGTVTPPSVSSSGKQRWVPKSKYRQ